MLKGVCQNCGVWCTQVPLQMIGIKDVMVARFAWWVNFNNCFSIICICFVSCAQWPGNHIYCTLVSSLLRRSQCPFKLHNSPWKCMWHYLRCISPDVWYIFLHYLEVCFGFNCSKSHPLNYLCSARRNRRSASAMTSWWKRGRRRWSEWRTTPDAKPRRAGHGSTMRGNSRRSANRESSRSASRGNSLYLPLVNIKTWYCYFATIHSMFGCAWINALWVDSKIGKNGWIWVCFWIAVAFFG